MNTCRYSILMLVIVLAALASAICLDPNSAATTTVEAAPVPAPSPDKPAYAGYKGVLVGLTADEARKKLGNPKDKSDTQDFYVYSDNESAQVYYDATKNVSLVSVSYVGKVNGIPTPKDVFGEDVAAKADGSVFKMVRYPKAGYWISYNKTGGDDPIVTITIQKMPGQ